MTRLHFQLHDFMAGAITRMVPTTTKPGKYTYKRLTFLPGKEYYTDDPAFARYIKNEVGDVREKSVRTPALVAKLQSRGISFENIKKCGSCPSAVSKIAYNPFTFKEDE